MAGIRCARPVLALMLIILAAAMKMLIYFFGDRPVNPLDLFQILQAGVGDAACRAKMMQKGVLAFPTHA